MTPEEIGFAVPIQISTMLNPPNLMRAIVVLNLGFWIKA